MFWLGLIVGMVLGGIAGVFVTACCVVAGREDEWMERQNINKEIGKQ